MITGFEIFKSWRFWLVLFASTSAVTLLTAGTYVLSVYYFPLERGTEGLFLLLAGFATAFLAVVAVGCFYLYGVRVPATRTDCSVLCYLGVLIAGLIVIYPEAAATHWLLIKPVLPATTDGSISMLASAMAANFFVVGAGRLIGGFELSGIHSLAPANQAEQEVSNPDDGSAHNRADA